MSLRWIGLNPADLLDVSGHSHDYKGLLRVSVLAVAIACASLAVLQAPPSEAARTPLATHMAEVESAVLQGYMGHTSTNSPRYYADGQWYAAGGIQCWNCYDSAATATAVLFDEGIGGSEYEQAAIETTNRAIAEHQQPDGAFEGTESANAPITTDFYAVELGIIYLELRGVLDSATRQRWATALDAAARYLIDSGQTTWYINGNINLRQTQLMWLAWQITGDPYFGREYESEWAFTVTPSQARWPGFGLRVSPLPSRPDGADGAGYLAESDGGAPGFDPEYTMAQLDIATQMYVFSREARWLRLMNLMFNQLQPLIEITSEPFETWELNATNGTRRDQLVTFIDPAPYLLVSSGDRPELEGGLNAQFARVEHDFLASTTFTNAGFYKSLADLSTVLLDGQWPLGAAAEGRVASANGDAGATASGCDPCPSPGVPTSGAPDANNVKLSPTSSKLHRATGTRRPRRAPGRRAKRSATRHECPGVRSPSPRGGKAKRRQHAKPDPAVVCRHARRKSG